MAASTDLGIHSVYNLKAYKTRPAGKKMEKKIVLGLSVKIVLRIFVMIFIVLGIVFSVNFLKHCACFELMGLMGAAVCGWIFKSPLPKYVRQCI